MSADAQRKGRRAERGRERSNDSSSGPYGTPGGVASRSERRDESVAARPDSPAPTKKNGPTHTKQVGPSPLDKPMILRTFVDSEPSIDIGASDRETAAQGRDAGGWYSVPY